MLRRLVFVWTHVCFSRKNNIAYLSNYLTHKNIWWVYNLVNHIRGRRDVYELSGWGCWDFNKKEHDLVYIAILWFYEKDMLICRAIQSETEAYICLVQIPKDTQSWIEGLCWWLDDISSESGKWVNSIVEKVDLATKARSATSQSWISSRKIEVQPSRNKGDERTSSTERWSVQKGEILSQYLEVKSTEMGWSSYFFGRQSRGSNSGPGRDQISQVYTESKLVEQTTPVALQFQDRHSAGQRRPTELIIKGRPSTVGSLKPAK